MNRTFVVVVLIIVLVGGLLLVSHVRRPKPAPPSTQDIWAANGIPVSTGVITRGDIERTVEVTGDINALKKVTLSAKIPGRVAQVFAREGEGVAQGMTVVLLDQQDAQSNVQQAQAGLRTARARLSQAQTNAKVTRIQMDAAIAQAKDALESAQARLAVVKKPTRTQEQMVAENAVTTAKANLDTADANFKRNEQLLKQGAISQAAFDIVKAQYVAAQSEHKSANERLAMIKEGGRAEDVQAAEAQVRSAKQQLRSAMANAAQNMLREEDIKQAKAAVQQAEAALFLAKQQLSYTYVKSPISGKLASRLTEPGQVVAAGQPLGDVVNLASLYFKGDVSETELAQVENGQTVRVNIDAMPDEEFTGEVSQIFPSGSTASRNFPVRIGIKSPGTVIRPGMFARGHIVTGVSRDTMLVPKDAIEERRGTKMVFTVRTKREVRKGKEKTVSIARRHDIEIANENTEFVEVKQPVDLKPGDAVVTKGRQNLQEGSKISLNGSK